MHRRSSIGALVAAGVTLALASLAGLAAAAPRPYAYVALGDSFASGEGIAPYLGTGRCDRSSRAYAAYVRPPGWARTVYAEASGGGAAGPANRYGSSAAVRSASGVSWALRACSGARTANVLPPVRDDGGLAKASLVTLTVGGNDAGYVDVLVQCGIFACATPAFERERAAIVDAVGPKVERVIAAIGKRAPSARILVVGYPQVFPATRKEQACPALRRFTGEMDMLRALGARLDATIARAVADAAAGGANATYVPVASRFAGHEVCGSKGAWINGIVPSTSILGIDPGSFHPNPKGQRDGYAAAVDAALR